MSPAATTVNLRFVETVNNFLLTDNKEINRRLNRKSTKFVNQLLEKIPFRMKRKISNGATITVKGKPDSHCITQNDKQLMPATYNLQTSGVVNVCDENEAT